VSLTKPVHYPLQTYCIVLFELLCRDVKELVTRPYIAEAAVSKYDLIQTSQLFDLDK